MSDDRSKLREVMGRHLDELQPRTPIEKIHQRARRGRLIMATSITALIAVVAASGAFVYGQLSNDSTQRVVGPGPTTEGGLIAFTTQDRNDMMPWIAVVPISGGEVTRLHEGRDPAWSPDGTRIAFGCDRGICTMNADGSGVIELTDPVAPAFDESPDWGPTGMIAFTRNYMDGKSGRDILLIPEDGGKEKSFEGQGPDDSDPTWSPDGSDIAFISGVGEGLEAPAGGFQLFVATAGGSRVEGRQLTTEGAARPDWSPDGRSILFDEASALWTAPAEGSDPQKLPVVSGRSFDVASSPSWAPDARRFAFTCSSRGTGNNDICLSDVGSHEWTSLVATGENEASPAWQPSVPTEDFAGDATFGHYTFSIQGGLDHRRDAVESVGIVEVSSDQGTVCLDSYMPGATSAHLRREGAEPWDRIVIFEIPTRYRTSMCARRLYEPPLQALIDNPTSYYIEFTNKFTGETLTAPLEIVGETSVDDGDRQDQATDQQGRVSCKDSTGDLMSEGSGDQSGPGPQPPDEDRPGTDLSGFSMARNSDGTLEMNWGTYGRIADSLDAGAKLSFVVTGSSKEPGYTFASITATLSNDRWKVLIRNEDDEADYLQTPEVAGNVLNLVIEPETVPRLMRGAFKWRAFSEWIPEPTRSASEIYTDYCPDSGFPKFEGRSS